uniref:Uncharacterized protein n=1 Tax=Anguilla anguilla TaxID=7936 RepID=A0A0E9WNW9_ANGAN
MAKSVLPNNVISFVCLNRSHQSNTLLFRQSYEMDQVQRNCITVLLHLL